MNEAEAFRPVAGYRAPEKSAARKGAPGRNLGREPRAIRNLGWPRDRDSRGDASDDRAFTGNVVMRRGHPFRGVGQPGVPASLG